MTGATYHKNNSTWQAKITFKGRQYYIGSYFTQQKARDAYLIKKKELLRKEEPDMK